MCHIIRCALIQLCRLLILIVFLNGICGHKCYVCKENCELFNLTTKFKYEEECPPKSTTCRAEILDGSVILRSCEEEHNFMLNDCQPLNGINYCYCSKELCNGLLTDKLLEHLRNTSDDEDDELEGSASSIGNNAEDDDNLVSVLQPVIPQIITDIAKSSTVTQIPKSALIIIIPILQYYQNMV